MGVYSRLASAIYNDLHAGLKGLTNEWTLSIEQLEDEIADLRMKMIHDRLVANIKEKHQFATTIKCIPVDCQPIGRCDCQGESLPDKAVPHFKMPVPFMVGACAIILYIGPTDMSEPYKVYTNYEHIRNLKGRRSKLKTPYVYVNMSPDKDGKIDAYIFNAPYVQQVTVTAVFRNIKKYMDEICCEYDDNSEILNSDISKAIVSGKTTLYAANLTNDRKTVI